jgi:hypothetical protein
VSLISSEIQAEMMAVLKKLIVVSQLEQTQGKLGARMVLM